MSTSSCCSVVSYSCHAVTDSQLAGGKARHAAGMEAWRLLSAHAWVLLGVRDADYPR